MWKDYLRLHWVIFIWGFTAILGKLMILPSVEIVFYRTLIAFSALYVLLYFRKRSLRISQSQLIKFLLTGSLIGFHWILFFGAARVSTVSVCLAGMATGSLWTSLLDPLLTRRQFQWFEVGLGGLALVGLYIIFRFEFDHALGLTMALASAILGAVFTIFNSRFTQFQTPLVITFYEMVGAWLTVALFLPLYGTWISPDGIQWLPVGWDYLWLLLLAVVCTVYAYAESVRLMKKFTAFAINLTNNLEPVYGIVLAAIIFGEHQEMTPEFYMGTGVILLAVLAYPIGKRLTRRRQHVPTIID
ncbi:Threonine/homoserine efflux transporter RhtA [Catalinimonas alkaloidigena]|uniref:Threonine/homoserine efflux transporter RhtA n=1 Tax=Catalinimonas alkaloidigena TaxID=1075417 RepID=A0A1G9UA36_9BACT|nr:DMT family transporter [Catalinimonas alkaloidigena]SDM56856.1 Threonine/homoserine efflux transporter RhtA [Catalinimonas alkaloidigena]